VDRETGERSQIDFGHVGDVVKINSRLLTVLLDQGYLPVISSLGADAERHSLQYQRRHHSCGNRAQFKGGEIDPALRC